MLFLLPSHNTICIETKRLFLGQNHLAQINRKLNKIKKYLKKKSKKKQQQMKTFEHSKQQYKTEEHIE